MDGWMDVGREGWIFPVALYFLPLSLLQFYMPNRKRPGVMGAIGQKWGDGAVSQTPDA
jgi:hypothetical protein